MLVISPATAEKKKNVDGRVTPGHDDGV